VLPPGIGGSERADSGFVNEVAPVAAVDTHRGRDRLRAPGSDVSRDPLTAGSGAHMHPGASTHSRDRSCTFTIACPSGSLGRDSRRSYQHAAAQVRLRNPGLLSPKGTSFGRRSGFSRDREGGTGERFHDRG